MRGVFGCLFWAKKEGNAFSKPPDFHNITDTKIVIYGANYCFKSTAATSASLALRMQWHCHGTKIYLVLQGCKVRVGREM